MIEFNLHTPTDGIALIEYKDGPTRPASDIEVQLYSELLRALLSANRMAFCMRQTLSGRRNPTYEKEVLAAYRKPSAPDSQTVFSRLLQVMEEDNVFYDFPYTISQQLRALEPIRLLVEAGYFEEREDRPWNHLDGDYWQCAAGERDEAAAHFSRAPEAYAVLDAVLNEIFDRPVGDTP